MKIVFEFKDSKKTIIELRRSEKGNFYLYLKESSGKERTIDYKNFSIANDEYACFIMRHINDLTKDKLIKCIERS